MKKTNLKQGIGDISKMMYPVELAQFPVTGLDPFLQVDGKMTVNLVTAAPQLHLDLNWDLSIDGPLYLGLDISHVGI